MTLDHRARQRVGEAGARHPSHVLVALLFFAGGVAAFVAREWTPHFYLAGSGAMIVNVGVAFTAHRLRASRSSGCAARLPFAFALLVVAVASFLVARSLADGTVTIGG